MAQGMRNRNPSRTQTTLIARLWRHEEGISALDFALVAPVLLLFMSGVIEVALVMFAQHVLEGATFSASRLGKTGATEAGLTREQSIVAALQQRAAGVLDISRVVITSVAYDQFGQIGQPEPFIDTNYNGKWDSGENYTDVNHNGQHDEDMGTAGSGNTKQVVVYTVTYPWPIFTPMIGPLMGINGAIDLVARTVVENEPF